MKKLSNGKALAFYIVLVVVMSLIAYPLIRLAYGDRPALAPTDESR